MVLSAGARVRRTALGLGLLLLLAGLAAALPGSPAHAEQRYTLKFATLIPKGTGPMKVLQRWRRELDERSGGRLKLRFYPGGIQGDEPQVLKKIRFGQLQGATFTGYGIGRIYSPARILEFPFLFDSYAEIDAVREQLMPEFRKGFRERGYELLGWAELGFIHFFSRKPIHSLQDLRRQRVWIWEGDRLSEVWFKVAHISPIPLSIADVYTSLSTGLIDTVYATPLAAAALQWANKAPYMTDVPMANGIGAIVVSNRFFRRLPEDLQALLRETGARVGRELTHISRVDNDKIIEVLEQNGLQRTSADLDPTELRHLSAQAAHDLAAEDYIPQRLFDRTRTLLSRLRGTTAAASTHP